MNRTSSRKTAASLLITASVLAFAAPALAHETLFASDASLGQAAESGERVTQQSGVTQIRLSGGGVASFVAGASFQIRGDGSVDLFAGTVTIAGSETSPVVVHLADQGEGRVSGRGSAASFSVDAREGGRNEARGHVLTGSITITFGTGSPRQFTAGQMWHGLGGRFSLVVANGATAVPTGDGANSTVEPMGPQDGERASAAAAAYNGVPVVLGDALAAAGASGDIVAAARRVQAASANPSIETYPARDLALLVAYAARLNGAYGGVPFNGAAADIIRTYLQFLSGGGAQGNFLSAYAGFMVQYLDLIRAGALPSSFTGASLAQINSFIAYRGRTVGFGSLSGQNKVLIDAYLAFIQGGGNADQFLVRYTDLTAAYFSYIRGGGTPAGFTGASQTTITAYLIFLRDAGLLANLTAQNQALLTAYLNSLTANGSGLAFADQYRTSLNLYYIYLQQGRLPSGYTAADVAALRQYLETLKATGLFDTVLGSQASFFNGYLIWLQGGGAIDGYAQLPANIFAGYTAALNAYYDYLKQGGTPSGYSTLTQAQITAYLTALQNAGASARYLGDLTTFWADYFAWINAGNNPNLFAGLPVPPDYPAFTSALNAYYFYLSNGGLPSNYSALTLEQLRTYINALIAAGRLSDLGGNASFLSAYFTYLGGGGAPNGYAQLPVYVSYQSALTAYYTYLQGGGIPGNYTALTLAQIQTYLQALINAGVYSSLFSGQTASFLTAYYNFVNGGGAANSYTGLPAYASYVSALNLYFVYLQGGGIPGNYTGLTLAQLQAYLQALIDAGVLSQFFTGSTLTFFQGYYTYVSGGGTANNYSGLATIVTGGGTNPNYAGGFTATTGVRMFAVLGSNSGGSYPNQTVSFNSDGSFASTTSFTPQTAQFTDVGGDSRGLVGRLYNGTVQMTGFATPLSYGTNNGMSYVMMAPIVGSLPTSGTVSYSVMSATRPVYDDGHTAAGTFAANLMIGLATMNYAINGTITMPDATYSVTAGNIATGTLVAPQSTSPTFYGMRPNLSAGPACPSGGCQLNMFGSFGGSNPQERLGLSYHSMSSPTGKTITGSVLFGAEGTTGGSGTGQNTTRTGQLMAYANKLIGTDSYANVSVTYNPSGVPVGFEVSNNEKIALGTTTVANSGNSGTTLYWSRWSGGTPSGTYFGDVPGAIGTNGGYHMISGTPVTHMPVSGSVAYDLAGYTPPTFQDERSAPGTLTGSAAVAFGSTPKVGFDLNVAIASQTYNVKTVGGVATPSSSGITIASDGTFDSPFNALTVTTSSSFCTPNCSAFIDGFLAGDAASHMGLSYAIRNNSNPQTFIDGTAAFTKGSALSQGTQAAPTGNNMWVRTVGKTFITGTSNASATGSFFSNSPVGTIAAADGQLQTGDLSAQPITRLTATNADYGTAGGAIGWARWAGGTVRYSDNTTAEIPANGGLAFVWGTPVTNMPTSGTVNYALAGSTKPTLQSGAAAPGTLNSATFSVNFANLTADFSANLTVNGVTYTPTNNAPMAIASNGTFSNFNSSSHILGFLAGPGASHAGVSYNIFGPGVYGTIAFAKPGP